jgi:glycosyltransferase involved in cell wall biosynthesis
MPPFRVGQFVEDLQPGALQRCACELAMRLDRRRFDLHVVASRTGPLAARLVRAGVRVTVRDLPTGPRATLPGLLRRGRFDLLHTFGLSADLRTQWARWVSYPVPLVHSPRIEPGRSRLRGALERLVGGAWRVIVCPSGPAAERHRAATHLPRHRYRVIAPGVASAGGGGDLLAGERYRRRWGVAPDETVVLAIGPLCGAGGTDTLLAAWRRIAGIGRGRLILAGDGPLRGEVDALMLSGPTGGSCQVVAVPDEPADLLAAADIYVLPGPALAGAAGIGEAMAAGAAIVQARGADPFEICPNGDASVVVRPGDPVELAGALSRLIRGPALRQSLGEAGRRVAIESLGLDRMAEKFAAVYEEILSRR